jgi:hypothetical protein
MLGGDWLFLDQLRFIDPMDMKAPRYIQIREIMHQLKEMISTGRDQMPALLAHQISRDGLKSKLTVARRSCG